MTGKDILLYGEGTEDDSRLNLPIHHMFKMLEELTIWDRESVEELFWKRIEIIYQMQHDN